MNRKNFCKSLAVGVAYLSLPTCRDRNSVANSESKNSYRWGQLKIGGGGYVTGIVIHPQNKNIMYIRTDVGGAYSWDINNETWIQMLDWIGPPQSNLIGVDGMAIDPNDPNRIYLALGKKINGAGGIYRSGDRGKTWTKLMDSQYEGNGRVDRWTGECIAVDPNSSETIYAGTRTDGLWRSTNDGAGWSKVEDVSDGFTGTNPTGIRTVVFDPGVKSGGKSSVIYVGVPQTGVYYSADGGESFSLISDTPENPARMQVVNRKLFVTHATGVAIWSDSHWQDITPAAGRNKNYVGLAVDKTNDNKIVIAQRYSSYYNPIYRSENRGETWEQINTSSVPANLHISIPWWPQKRFSAATSCMAYSPDGSGELYYTDWFGIWKTPNVWSSMTNWYTMEKGHEETVVLTLVAPSDGALVYSGMADNFGFRHRALNTYPQKRLYSTSEGFSIAICEKHPSNIAILGAKSWGGDETRLATSSDYGQTWNDRSLPEGTSLGRIAISSTNRDNMIYMPGEGKVYYTKDRGNSWAICQGAPKDTIKMTAIWNQQFPLKADRVDGSFYIFKDCVFYASTDGGATWQVRGEITLTHSPSRFLNVVTTPGEKGVVWVSLGKNGLWKTANRGKSFIQIDDFGKAKLFSLGAPAADCNLLTAYCYGTIGNRWGLYRSIDMGKSWIRINDDQHQFLGNVRTIAADRKKFGQIYIGTSGSGIYYGQPVSIK